MPPYHTPVLLSESIDALRIRPDGCYADATFGGGGHSRALFARLGAGARLYSFDQDADAEANAAGWRDAGGARFQFVYSNFRYLANWLRYYHEPGLDGLLADLGVSGHHFDDATRGFSFRADAPLDMRMNRHAARTAADIVNDYDTEALTSLLRIYGEVKNPHRVAEAIAAARANARIETTTQLAEAAEKALPREREKKELAKVFQALRIEVNGEMQALEQLLRAACQTLNPGGRLVVITYHSLEDRMVKNIIRAGNVAGRVEKDFYGRASAPLRAVGKVITPTPEEQERNPRSRSAKLRVAEKPDDEE